MCEMAHFVFKCYNKECIYTHMHTHSTHTNANMLIHVYRYCEASMIIYIYIYIYIYICRYKHKHYTHTHSHTQMPTCSSLCIAICEALTVNWMPPPSFCCTHAKAASIYAYMCVYIHKVITCGL